MKNKIKYRIIYIYKNIKLNIELYTFIKIEIVEYIYFNYKFFCIINQFKTFINKDNKYKYNIQN